MDELYAEAKKLDPESAKLSGEYCCATYIKTPEAFNKKFDHFLIKSKD